MQIVSINHNEIIVLFHWFKLSRGNDKKKNSKKAKGNSTGAIEGARDRERFGLGQRSLIPKSPRIVHAPLSTGTGAFYIV